MKRLKAILKKLFFLPPLPTALISIPSFILAFVLLSAEDHSFITYIVYALSAYALVITVTGIANVVEAVQNGIKKMTLIQKIRSTTLGKRLLDDIVFRSEITLYVGLFINLLYVALNLFSGIRYRSMWFIALAFYYTLLSAMRTVLVRYVSRKTVGQNVAAEFRRYRACGVILLLMNQALVGIIVHMVTQNKGFSYSGFMIYAMAMYSFYLIIAAVVNVVKFRNCGSPVMSAAKVVNLTAALVSMLSLETAMLTQFGSDEPVFRRIMLAASGGVVCVIVLTMAIYMIARSTVQLKNNTQDQDEKLEAIKQ